MPKHCDESVCSECIYIGDGGFMCGITLKTVIEDFIPTENYQSECSLDGGNNGHEDI